MSIGLGKLGREMRGRGGDMPKGEGMRQVARELRERREAEGKGWSVLRDRDARIRMMGGK